MQAKRRKSAASAKRGSKKLTTEMDVEAAPRLTGFQTLDQHLLKKLVSFFLTPDGQDAPDLCAMRFTCRSLRAAVNSREVWADISTVFPCGRLNLAALCFRSEKSQGTEGTCMHVVGWRDGQEYALKKGRPFPQFEGVPYYMIREMSALRVLAHPCIAPLLAVSLRRSELHMLFPYVEFTLQDLLAHKAPLQRRESIDLMAQLTDAVAYCHKNGVLHRNLKPKHLLIQLAEPHASLATERLVALTKAGGGARPQMQFTSEELRGARLLVSDFALVRICSRPQKAFTAEVISLWYRPPEILMGRCAYDESIDVWSMGCVFAEMLRGSALFMGISQVDQLFQVFSKLGTPSETSWPGFNKMPYYNEALLPHWAEVPGLGTASSERDGGGSGLGPRGSIVGGAGGGLEGAMGVTGLAAAAAGMRLGRYVPGASLQELDLLKCCLRCDPRQRASALQLRAHPALQNAAPMPAALPLAALAPPAAAPAAGHSSSVGSSSDRQAEGYASPKVIAAQEPAPVLASPAEPAEQRDRGQAWVQERARLLLGPLGQQLRDCGGTAGYGASRTLRWNQLAELLRMEAESSSADAACNKSSGGSVGGAKTGLGYAAAVCFLRVQTRGPSGHAIGARTIFSAVSLMDRFLARAPLLAPPPAGGVAEALSAEINAMGEGGEEEMAEMAAVAMAVATEQEATGKAAAVVAVMAGAEAEAGSGFMTEFLQCARQGGGEGSDGAVVGVGVLQALRTQLQGLPREAMLVAETLDNDASIPDDVLAPYRLWQGPRTRDMIRLALCCVHVASKCEDVTYLCLDDVVPVWAAPTSQLLALEERLLNALDFHTYTPSAVDFLGVLWEECNTLLPNRLPLVDLGDLSLPAACCCSFHSATLAQAEQPSGATQPPPIGVLSSPFVDVSANLLSWATLTAADLAGQHLHSALAAGCLALAFAMEVVLVELRDAPAPTSFTTFIATSPSASASIFAPAPTPALNSAHPSPGVDAGGEGGGDGGGDGGWQLRHMRLLQSHLAAAFPEEPTDTTSASAPTADAGAGAAGRRHRVRQRMQQVEALLLFWTGLQLPALHDCMRGLCDMAKGFPGRPGINAELQPAAEGWLRLPLRGEGVDPCLCLLTLGCVFQVLGWEALCAAGAVE